MKLTFTYTDTPDLSSLSRDDIFNTYFEIPDEALHLIGVRERILKIAELVSTFSNACLHVSCKELDIKNHLVRTVELDPHTGGVYGARRVLLLCFERFALRKKLKRYLKVLLPVGDIVADAYHNHYHEKLLFSLNMMRQDTTHPQNMQQLVDQLLVLLGADPPAPRVPGNWKFSGFYPLWRDNALIKRRNDRSKRYLAEQRKQQKEEEKRKAREAKLAEKAAQLAEKGILPAEPPKTGAGRRVGAVPGIFKGIQFRSQLEIRFATELEARGIKWVYEGERLGDGSYLVDFYLPDYGAWVEVKGKFEPRDDYLLKDAATYLKQERGQRLFVYTSGKPLLVNPSGYRVLDRKDFWTILLK